MQLVPGKRPNASSAAAPSSDSESDSDSNAESSTSTARAGETRQVVQAKAAHHQRLGHWDTESPSEGPIGAKKKVTPPIILIIRKD